jgi:hypothetical protein
LGRIIERQVSLQQRRYYESFRFGNPTELTKDDGLALLRMADCDAFEFRLYKTLMATEPRVIYEAWPATWWDAFKERWFPRWLRKRYPVRFKSIHVEKYGVYPEIPKPADDGTYLCIHVMDVSRWGHTDNGSAEELYG